MNPYRPFMLLRARPNSGQQDAFRTWFRSVHLRDVQLIPGIAAVTSGETAGGTRLGFYEFDSSETVQAALSSPQAAYARGTWEQWAPHLEELSIEIWAALLPLGIFQSRS